MNSVLTICTLDVISAVFKLWLLKEPLKVRGSFLLEEHFYLVHLGLCLCSEGFGRQKVVDFLSLTAAVFAQADAWTFVGYVWVLTISQICMKGRNKFYQGVWNVVITSFRSSSTLATQ